MEKNQLTLLATRRFLPLFVTQFLGAFNDNIFKNALVILISYNLIELGKMSPQILVTLAAGIFILPFFLFSATAGQLADKYEKSRLISIIKFIEILLMGVASVGFYLQSLYLLVFVLFMLGVHSTFFGPLKYAILPDQLHDDELIAATGLIDAGTFLAILLGTILGGVLIIVPNGKYFISAMVLIAALAGWSSSWFVPKTKNYHPDLNVRYNIMTETFKLIRYSTRHREIFISILGISWFWLIGATFLTEFPVFAKNILYANEHVVTFFLTLFSIGLAVGSLLCNRLLKGEVSARYVPLGALGITLFTLDLYFAARGASALPDNMLMTLTQFLKTFNGWRITVDLMFIAICGGLYAVPLYAILQRKSEKTHRARVIASNNVMNALFMVLAAVATVLMLKMGFSVNEVFLSVAIANGVIAIYLRKLK